MANKLLSGLDASGSSSAVAWHGGLATVAAEGTWDGASIVAEISPDDGSTWISLGEGATLEADGAFNLQLPAECKVRVTATISGTSSLNCWLIGPN